MPSAKQYTFCFDFPKMITFFFQKLIEVFNDIATLKKLLE